MQHKLFIGALTASAAAALAPAAAHAETIAPLESGPTMTMDDYGRITLNSKDITAFVGHDQEALMSQPTNETRCVVINKSC